MNVEKIFKCLAFEKTAFEKTAFEKTAFGSRFGRFELKRENQDLIEQNRFMLANRKVMNHQ
jgi:hypothetical protein